MLTITDAALEGIKSLIEQTDAAGIRISTSTYSFNGSGPAVQLEPAEGPSDEDEVIDADTARIFLAPTAAALDNKVLDAEFEAGELRFELREQE